MRDVWLEIGVGYKVKLKNVRLIYDIRLNFISVKAMNIEDYHPYFGRGGICKITKEPLVVAKDKSLITL